METFGGTDSGVQGAIKTLDSHFAKADAILQLVNNKLEIEFEVTYPGNANPLKLLARAKRLQDELSLLREESDKLLAAKQDVIDAARTTLVKNRQLLSQLQIRSGLPVSSDADDPVYSSFLKTLEEWDQQLEMVSVTENAHPDLNLELFRSKVFKRDE